MHLLESLNKHLQSGGGGVGGVGGVGGIEGSICGAVILNAIIGSVVCRYEGDAENAPK